MFSLLPTPLCPHFSSPPGSDATVSASTPSFCDPSSVKSSHRPLCRDDSSLGPQFRLRVGCCGPGILFPHPGYPDLSTLGPLVGSRADVGPKDLTLASGSPAFPFRLLHSSAGAPWVNYRTSGSLSFLMSTRGSQTVQAVKGLACSSSSTPTRPP